MISSVLSHGPGIRPDDRIVVRRLGHYTWICFVDDCSHGVWPSPEKARQEGLRVIAGTHEKRCDTTE